MTWDFRLAFSSESVLSLDNRSGCLRRGPKGKKYYFLFALNPVPTFSAFVLRWIDATALSSVDSVVLVSNKCPIGEQLMPVTFVTQAEIIIAKS